MIDKIIRDRLHEIIKVRQIECGYVSIQYSTMGNHRVVFWKNQLESLTTEDWIDMIFITPEEYKELLEIYQ